LKKGLPYRSSFRGGDDFMQFHALKPHRFIYQHPRLGFVLPEAKGVSMAASQVVSNRST